MRRRRSTSVALLEVVAATVTEVKPDGSVRVIPIGTAAAGG